MPVNERVLADSQMEQYEPAADEGREIDLVELFYRLLEKMIWIVLAAVIAAGAFAAYTHFFVEPTYSSTAKLYVVSTSESAINLTDLNLGDKVADDFVQVFKNRDVYDQVVVCMKEDYGVDLEYSYREIQKMMNISVISDTRILQITVTSLDAKEAEQIATAYAKTAKDFVAAVMGLQKPTDFERAREGVLNAPNVLRNAILGFVGGAVAAMAVIVLMFIFDDRIRAAEQLQKKLGLSTLGMMPVQEGERKSSRRKVKGEQK